MKSLQKEQEFHDSYERAVEKARSKLGRTYPMMIDGKEVWSKDGTFLDKNPANTDQIVGVFQKGTREDAKSAIRAAKDAFDSWSQTPYHVRVGLYRKAADLMSREKFNLAAEMSFENGKNRFEAMADVDEAIDFLRYYSNELEVNGGFEREMGHVLPNEHAKSILRPYGVWSVIAPFNFPLAIPTGMSTGASITGNTIVLKPASDTPLLSFELYKVMETAGIPHGVFNYVTGPGSTLGAELTENRDVGGVVFTGSWDVGARSSMEFQRELPRPFIAEMGGKNATVVTQNADLEKASEGVIRAAFGFGGQKCSACSRVYVQKSVKDQFVGKLVDKTLKINIGDPTKKETFLGPLINESAYKNFQSYIGDAKSSGKVLCGGSALKEEQYSKGYFVQPTIVVDSRSDSRLLKTELFVPILLVQEYEDLQEAIKEMNSVEYGLTGGIFSNDKGELDEFFAKAQAGVLYANRASGSTTGAVVGVQPFVGWKRSGSSGKGAGGPYYLPQFLREQSQTFYD